MHVWAPHEIQKKRSALLIEIVFSLKNSAKVIVQVKGFVTNRDIRHFWKAEIKGKKLLIFSSLSI